MEISITLDKKSLKTKEHIQNLPVSQILESESGELYLIVELWGMYENWLLVKVDSALIESWKKLPVNEQGQFFNNIPNKWLLLSKEEDAFKSVEEFPQSVISYLNRRRFTPKKDN